MRRLIRPNLTEIKEQMAAKQPRKKTPPPYETHAENYYYLKQMNTKTPMVVVLNNGEVIRGVIEWYDKECVKINRVDAPNLLVYKHSINYIHKDIKKTQEA